MTAIMRNFQTFEFYVFSPTHEDDYVLCLIEIGFEEESAFEAVRGVDDFVEELGLGTMLGLSSESLSMGEEPDSLAESIVNTTMRELWSSPEWAAKAQQDEEEWEDEEWWDYDD